MLLGAQSAAASLVLQNITHCYICSRGYLSTNNLICHFCTFPPLQFLDQLCVVILQSILVPVEPVENHPSTTIEYLLDIIQTDQTHLIVGKMGVYTNNNRRYL